MRSFALLLAATLLAAQLALAAYACPGAGSGVTAAVEEPVAALAQGDVAPPDCEDRIGAADPAFALLCAEHCQADPQNGQPPPQPLPVLLRVALYDILPHEATLLAPRATPVDADRGRVGQPPHAIVHCCRRD